MMAGDNDTQVSKLGPSEPSCLMSSSMKLFEQFHMGFSVETVLTICLNGFAPLNKIAAMPIYGKTFKNLLHNQGSFDAESW